MIDQNFWKDKKVLITGHTGFKGSWLSMWLYSMGAKITGYALDPHTTPNLYQLAKIDSLVSSIISDIRDKDSLEKVISTIKPEIIFHLAAQPIVRDSYKNPIETYEINVMGTVYLLEAVRKSKSVKVVVNVTTDKVYENKEWYWGYRENEPLGGYDPYSSSKACSELVTSAYRNSFFNPKDYKTHGLAIATARAGNVIGGGDWAFDRLIPDITRALLSKKVINIRNPKAVRPWQHVLEPLSGYLILAQKLYQHGARYTGAWNFGPDDNDLKMVEWITNYMINKWGNRVSYKIDLRDHPHETTYLKLDNSKAKLELGWYPKWNLEIGLEKVIEWIIAYQQEKDLLEFSLQQIEEYSYTEV